MKISHLVIKNFKQFKDLSLDLTYPKGHENEGQPLNKICIIGQSGTGKTNLLDIIKKSVIDFSNNQTSYKPFNEFVGQSTDDKYITNTFVTKSNIEVKALFTKDKSQIDFQKKNDLELFSSFEKNYFVGTKDYSSFNKIVENKEIDTQKMTSSDKALLDKLTSAKAELILNSLSSNKMAEFYKNATTIGRWGGYNKFLEKSDDEKLRDINSAINDLESKYQNNDTIEHSLKKLKAQNFIDKYVININDENENIWEIMKSKIEDYQNLRSQYNDLLTSKLLEDDRYSKENYRQDILDWESKNENLLEKISFVLNDILKYFNLELTKIDENQKNYNGLIFKDLSNGNIIDYENLSTGTKNLISTFIPLKTYAPKDSILLIDEPENSFYPNIQKLLTNLYMEAGENNQIIFATHSPIIASNFEPWEVVELKFDKNNQIYREVYFEGENHINNYFVDPRMLTWTGILTEVFDLSEDSNFSFREKKLMEYATFKAEIKVLQDEKEKELKFIELKKISKILGLKN
ncbi:putative nucleotidyltransferase, AbiEii toxin family [Arcobacter venerupis]|uniref:Nucleotidyltransferase, AbiEii toxin family n=1 Tax=Arcobacter venerupis TaxID=1054033 RepID=A0AAE7B7F1_9BACT|nr:AAA family ATPase [Arcobacter venerupis]QKF66763.1 putative nucleotidyltransferase, AbiEii toxin family [Arcobacter venerupis]RWS49760.1 hypothetical protein CKA56_06645 [Arcobacter venerupis]